jgi:hypothetical protein
MSHGSSIPTSQSVNQGALQQSARRHADGDNPLAAATPRDDCNACGALSDVFIYPAGGGRLCMSCWLSNRTGGPP